jgi:hypothetical protein
VDKQLLILIIHPVAWLFVKADQYRNAGLDATVWILLACIGIPTWVFFARLLAELPGIKTGRMYLWWAIFTVFHIWGFIAYLLFERFALGFVLHQRVLKRIVYSDRRAGDIYPNPLGIAGEEDHGLSLTPTLPTVRPEDKSVLSSENPFDDR